MTAMTNSAIAIGVVFRGFASAGTLFLAKHSSILSVLPHVIRTASLTTIGLTMSAQYLTRISVLKLLPYNMPSRLRTTIAYVASLALGSLVLTGGGLTLPAMASVAMFEGLNAFANNVLHLNRSAQSLANYLSA